MLLTPPCHVSPGCRRPLKETSSSSPSSSSTPPSLTFHIMAPIPLSLPSPRLASPVPFLTPHLVHYEESLRRAMMCLQGFKWPWNATFSTMAKDSQVCPLMLSLRSINNAEGPKCVEPDALEKCQHTHSHPNPPHCTPPLFSLRWIYILKIIWIIQPPFWSL